jgi:hypothetical protein
MIGRERGTVRPNAGDPGFLASRRRVVFDRGQRRRKSVDFHQFDAPFRARFDV